MSTDMLRRLTNCRLLLLLLLLLQSLRDGCYCGLNVHTIELLTVSVHCVLSQRCEDHGTKIWADL